MLGPTAQIWPSRRWAGVPMPSPAKCAPCAFSAHLHCCVATPQQSELRDGGLPAAPGAARARGGCEAAPLVALAPRSPRSQLADIILFARSQVRAVCVTPEGALLTGSRDKTIKLWQEGEDGAYVEDKTLVRGDRAAWGTTAAAAAAAATATSSRAAGPPHDHHCLPTPSRHACRWDTPTSSQQWHTCRPGCWRAAPAALWCRGRATRL